MRPQSRRPVELYRTPGGLGNFRIHGASGARVLFEGSFSGEGGGEDTTIGWFDGKTSQARSGQLAGSVSNEVRDVVVAPDGGVGVVAALEDEHGIRVGYLAPGKRALRGEFGLSMAPGYEAHSLAFSGAALTWKAAGVARTVALTGEAVTCASGTTLVESEGARVFEVLPARKTTRGFQADVLAACARGATVPRELGVTDLYDQQDWELQTVKPFGARVAFIVAERGVGALDGGEVRFALADDVVQDVAVGADGTVAFAAPGIVARLTATGWDRMAELGGTLANDSLAVADGLLRWRTTDGVAHSTPLSGETPIDCAVEPTLLSRGGIRVFEHLPPSGGDVQLYGCVGGAPVLLLTGPRNSSWKVVGLGVKNGSAAVIASGVRGNRLIAFGATPLQVVTPKASLAFGVRNVAFAPDGRVALVMHAGRKWTISAMTGGRERTLTHPKDGVRRGSLTFDGKRVTWHNLAGKSRSVALP